jgi:hypothetical protein
MGAMQQYLKYVCFTDGVGNVLGTRNGITNVPRHPAFDASTERGTAHFVH